ncbi:TMV resistance protein N-like [Quercus lobata]|uniref:TMV resistance protein N-like n=1 Tax=Quercus lobata TaxID=97700 RepID=UPI001244CC7A|nr:TMV resistance protein N-like [Quercus lobata]
MNSLTHVRLSTPLHTQRYFKRLFELFSITPQFPKSLAHSSSTSNSFMASIPSSSSSSSYSSCSSSYSSSCSSSYSSSSSTYGSKHDVFISFRGEDTRKKFTDHLYAGLEQKGISTFRDDENLERGTHIGPGLFKAIEESMFAVVILSSEYASSRWCLIELAKIIDCMKNTGLIVLPVFHYVDPSDVRNQREIYAEAFKKHEEHFKDSNEEDVYMWKVALTKVANISGWDLRDRHESKVIQEIVGTISSELNRRFSKTISKDLVGIDSRAEEMLDYYLCEGLGGVRFVGIWGMGGIGKTTLAQEIYRRISSNFETSSFIANVREETQNQGLVSLQKQLLSEILVQSKIRISNVREGINVIGNRLRDKKVLIVLDDVDQEEQLEALAGKHDWFGLGSRIILTSRDRHLLRRRCGVDDIYAIRGLSDYEALLLFSWRAFKKSHLNKEDYVKLSKDFVNYSSGHPLVITVVGASLFAKGIDEWKTALDKLKETSDHILDALKMSFDELINIQKELFLDIACFFKGENINRIRDILTTFGYYPDYNIDVLIDRSLITIDAWGTLWMHDLLQNMGQEIVRRECPKDPSRRSRLWLYEDVLHVLKNNTGTELIQGIVLKEHVHKTERLNVESLSKMKNLRMLKIQDVLLPNHLNYLSNEICIIEWHRCPLNSMPANFQPNKLVELKMHCSAIIQLWKGIVTLDKLKLIDLSDSQKLIETPDFSGAPNLKHLILRRCTRLYKIHASIRNLRWLIQLDLNGCKCLQILPPKISLESLEVFDLSGCSRLKKFPEIVGDMSCLSKLDLDKTAIKELPISVQNLTNLTFLSLKDCKNLSSLGVCCNWNFLKTLALSGCSKLKKFPEIVENMSHLTELYLNETAIEELPSSLEHLTGLTFLSLRNCKNLSSLTDAICTMISLKILILSGCSKLDELPENLGNLEGLEVLDVSGTAIKALPTSVVSLKNLRVISLRLLCRCEGLSSKSMNKRLSFLLFLGFLLLLVVFHILLSGRKYFCLPPKNYCSAI